MGKASQAVLIVAIAVVPAISEAQGQSKQAVCHRPPRNPANAHTLFLPVPAIQAHLGHGDFLGTCDWSTTSATQSQNSSSARSSQSTEGTRAGGHGKHRATNVDSAPDSTQCSGQDVAAPQEGQDAAKGNDHGGGQGQGNGKSHGCEKGQQGDKEKVEPE